MQGDCSNLVQKLKSEVTTFLQHSIHIKHFTVCVSLYSHSCHTAGYTVIDGPLYGFIETWLIFSQYDHRLTNRLSFISTRWTISSYCGRSVYFVMLCKNLTATFIYSSTQCTEREQMLNIPCKVIKLDFSQNGACTNKCFGITFQSLLYTYT
jgi:hypothetical protein